MKNLFIILTLPLLVYGCSSSKKDQESDTGEVNHFGAQLRAEFQTEINGTPIDLYTLKNASGMEVNITNYGGRIVSLFAPDKDGNFADVIAGYGSIDDFLNKPESYYGCIVGRYGNRIGNASFTLDGQTISLAANENGNQLHGGMEGFHKKTWAVENYDSTSLTLTYTSPDGDQGYPGTLEAKVVYSLSDDNELKIEYFATTDKTTVVNMTNHSYFNLAGMGSGSINDHLLSVYADHITEVDEQLIPTGTLIPVEGTPFDFNTATAIGARINEDHPQLKTGNGYDHNWVVKQEMNDEMVLHADLYEPNSGRFMEVYSIEPGIQFYGGNFMDGKTTGKYGKTFEYRSALCLETQHFPDSPNHPDFPSTTLNPGEEYYTYTIYKFSTK